MLHSTCQENFEFFWHDLNPILEQVYFKESSQTSPEIRTTCEEPEFSQYNFSAFQVYSCNQWMYYFSIFNIITTLQEKTYLIFHQFYRKMQEYLQHYITLLKHNMKYVLIVDLFDSDKLCKARYI